VVEEEEVLAVASVALAAEVSVVVVLAEAGKVKDRN
jgi:hypothetical protein